MQALRKVDDWMHRLGDPDASVSEFELHLVLRDLDQNRLGASAGESFVLRGLALGRLEQHADALEAFNHAVAHGEDRWEVHRNRGVALLHLEDPERAASSLLRASECEGGYNAAVLDTLARMFIVVGAFSAAREVLDAAIELTGNSHDYVLLANTAAYVGEPMLALRLAADAAGMSGREDLEAVAHELLRQDIPSRLEEALHTSLEILEKARQAVEGDFVAPTSSMKVVEESLRVFDAFSPLRESANALVLDEAPDDDPTGGEDRGQG